MSEHVLFLALGATRRRAAVDETARVVARGDQATLVITDRAQWRTFTVPPGVRLVQVKDLELRHAWMPAEQLLLFRIPGKAFRVVRSERAAGVYQRRIADRLHRRVFLPLLRRRPGAAVPRLIHRRLDGRPVDLLVVNDPASMPAAVALLAGFDRGGSPRVAYSIDDAVAALENR
jgi:hypothetical protein